MRRLGYFLHVSSSGRIIAKLTLPRPPRIGTKVFNSQGRFIGRITDVIGPVRAPYVVIKPLTPGIELRRYEELYIR